jgi:hypothetical protein
MRPHHISCKHSCDCARMRECAFECILLCLCYQKRPLVRAKSLYKRTAKIVFFAVVARMLVGDRSTREVEARIGNRRQTHSTPPFGRTARREIRREISAQQQLPIRSLTRPQSTAEYSECAQRGHHSVDGHR